MGTELVHYFWVQKGTYYLDVGHQYCMLAAFVSESRMHWRGLAKSTTYKDSYNYFNAAFWKSKIARKSHHYRHSLCLMPLLQTLTQRLTLLQLTQEKVICQTCHMGYRCPVGFRSAGKRQLDQECFQIQNVPLKTAAAAVAPLSFPAIAHAAL